MYYLALSKEEIFYIPPIYGRRFTGLFGMQHTYKRKIIDSFRTLKEGLDEINKTYYDWHTVKNVFSATGEGKRIDIFENGKHKIYTICISSDNWENYEAV